MLAIVNSQIVEPSSPDTCFAEKLITGDDGVPVVAKNWLGKGSIFP